MFLKKEKINIFSNNQTNNTYLGSNRMKKESLTFILISCLILGTTVTTQVLIMRELSLKQGLSFTDEDVIITVNETIAKFYARYAIKNYEKTTNYWISLPFALKPWDINLTINDEALDYSWTESYVEPEPIPFDAITFQVEIAEGEKLDIEVSYYRNYESIFENNTQYGLFRYIVGSTRSWDQPLNFAHFELWQEAGSIKTLIETRDYTNWYPSETFLYFYFELNF